MTHAPGTPSTKKPIPEFSSYEEEAEFWDTHDVTDYWDEWQVADVRPEGPVGHLVGIPITSEQMRVLSERARAEGTNEVELARRWVAERLESADSQDQDPPRPACEESR